MLLDPKNCKSELSTLQIMQAVRVSVDTKKAGAEDDTKTNRVYSRL